MRIVLHSEMIFETGLSYADATKALELANKSPAAKHITFSIAGVPGVEGWALQGRHDELTKLFINNPEDFVIEV